MPRKWHELGPFTVFDLETTGLSPSREKIVEIAAVRIETDCTQIRFNTLVNPGQKIPRSASSIHNITNEMVADAPRFTEAGRNFMELAEGSTLVAHNARFDLGFLQESLLREGMDLWQGKTIDSIPIVKEAFPGLKSYSLGFLRRYFALGDDSPHVQAHRAHCDVEWTLEIFQMAMSHLLRMSE